MNIPEISEQIKHTNLSFTVTLETRLSNQKLELLNKDLTVTYSVQPDITESGISTDYSNIFSRLCTFRKQEFVLLRDTTKYIHVLRIKKINWNPFSIKTTFTIPQKQQPESNKT